MYQPDAYANDTQLPRFRYLGHNNFYANWTPNQNLEAYQNNYAVSYQQPDTEGHDDIEFSQNGLRLSTQPFSSIESSQGQSTIDQPYANSMPFNQGSITIDRSAENVYLNNRGIRLPRPWPQVHPRPQAWQAFERSRQPPRPPPNWQSAYSNSDNIADINQSVNLEEVDFDKVDAAYGSTRPSIGHDPDINVDLNEVPRY